jgi:hypothetical protein
VRRLGLLTSLAFLAVVDSALAQAGGGSSGFGGGGGGGGGGGFGGGSPGDGEGGDGIGLVIVVAIFAVVGLAGAIGGWRYRRKVRARAARVRTASAEADAYFAPGRLEREARDLFVQAQAAWDARDRARLAELVGPDLLVEWNRRLDDFDSKGWRNRVSVAAEPVIQYVGLTNPDCRCTLSTRL